MIKTTQIIIVTSLPNIGDNTELPLQSPKHAQSKFCTVPARTCCHSLAGGDNCLCCQSLEVSLSSGYNLQNLKFIQKNVKNSKLHFLRKLRFLMCVEQVVAHHLSACDGEGSVRASVRSKLFNFLGALEPLNISKRRMLQSLQSCKT